jgi:HSP20 family molecular chaperone IbpA
MNTFTHRIWIWVDGLLVVAVLMLLVLVWHARYFGRDTQSTGHQPESTDRNWRAPGREPEVAHHQASDPRASKPAILVRPVRLGGLPMPRDVRPQWCEQGVCDTEWEKVPVSPGLDMIQTDHGYVVAFSQPNMRQEDDIRIDCVQGSLKIETVVRDVRGNAKGVSCRRIRLPADSVFDSGMESALSNGVLRIFIPRAVQP